MHKNYDVCVIGGGTAGVVAAIQAARAHVSVLLVEKTAQLGGTMTGAGVAFPGLFFAWKKPVVAGIGWELCLRALEEAGGRLPDFMQAGTSHSAHQIRLNEPLFAMICDEMVLESGAHLLFHAMPAEISRIRTGWNLRLCAKEGLRDLRCKVLVDGTGDANAVALAGFPVRRIREDTVQPASSSCRMSGYDPGRIDFAALTRAYRQGVAAGEVRETDGGWSLDAPSPAAFVRSRGKAGNHIGAINAADSEGKTRAEIEGRRSILRMYRFLKKQPGFETLSLDSLCPECGIRETVTIEGVYTITLADYESGRLFDDAVGFMYYPVDEHVMRGGGLNAWPLKPGVVPSIPRSALLPKGSRNLIAAGRSIGSDRMANSGLRVQCSCMVMGQAAGAMAALAVETGVPVGELPIREVRALLRAHGAIVPE